MPATALTRAQTIVAAQIARRAAHPLTGVCWSAMTPPAPDVETVEGVAARLEREDAERAVWRQTPEGRFHAAASLIFHATGDERLLQCHSRGLPTNIAAAEAALSAEMEGPAADEARSALSDWVVAHLASEIAERVAA